MPVSENDLQTARELKKRWKINLSPFLGRM